MGTWKVGLAKRVFTPPLGLALAGYGLRPHRKVEEVLDDLHVRALVFDDGKTKAALVSVDVITLNAALTQNIRTRVEKETGIPAGAILLSATHSHSTPTANFFRQWGTLDPNFVRLVEKSAVEAILEADRLRAPAALGCGEAAVAGIAVNRVRKDGPVDHSLRVLGIRAADGAALRAAAVNFACHPVCMDQETHYVSADYPGRVVRELERGHPGALGAFFQGASGDINPVGLWKGPDAAQAHGHTLAAGARQILEGLKFSGQGDLAFSQMDCELPLDLESARREATQYLFQGAIRKGHGWLAQGGFMREWAHEVLGLLASQPPDRLRCEVYALRIGDLAIVGLPGEMYTLIGQAIRAASPFPQTWVVGFANGNIGYVVDPRDYAEETYASCLAPKIMGYPPYKPEAWEVMAAVGIRALKKL